MLNIFKKPKKELSEAQKIEILHKNAEEMCDKFFAEKFSHFGLQEYRYNAKEAVEELGLDEDMIWQLVDDYVAQIIKAIIQFDAYLEKLQNSQDNQRELDYTPFRELAHKNLGVARNLRIKDAEALLYDLMREDDLKHLLACLEALKVCAIKLSPKCAYNTIKLIKVKNALDT
jgi:histidyl-tRNA synthetase